MGEKTTLQVPWSPQSSPKPLPSSVLTQNPPLFFFKKNHFRAFVRFWLKKDPSSNCGESWGGVGYASGLVQPLSTGCPWSAKSLGHGCTLPPLPLPGLEAGLVLSQPSFIMVAAQGTLHITAWPSSACSLLVLVPHPLSALQWEKTSTQPGLPSCWSQLQQSAMGALVGT